MSPLSHLTSPTPTKSNLYLANSLAASVSENARAKYHVLFPLLKSYQSISPGPRFSLWTIRNMIRFYSEELLAPRPTPKLEDHTLSAVRDCLFNIFATTLHLGGLSSFRSLRTPHPVVIGTHVPRIFLHNTININLPVTEVQYLQAMFCVT